MLDLIAELKPEEKAAFRLRADHPLLYQEAKGWQIVSLTWTGPAPRPIPAPPALDHTAQP
jgi:hypothetical protein